MLISDLYNNKPPTHELNRTYELKAMITEPSSVAQNIINYELNPKLCKSVKIK